MRRVEQIHVGTFEASGFIFDPTVIGVTRTQYRVLAHWQPASRLFALPDARWLLTIPETHETSTQLAPGLVATGDKGSFSTAPSPNQPAAFVHGWHGGEPIAYAKAELTELDPADWIEFDTLLRLEPVIAPPVERAIEAPTPQAVDLRRRAKVTAPSPQVARMAAELQAQAEGQAAAIGLGPAGGVGMSGGKAGRRSGRGRGAGAAPKQNRQPRESLFTKMLLRSPLKNEIGRKHAKYLESLTADFTAGRFDEALRNAVSLGGLAGGGRTLRLPSRRQNLDFTGGGGIGATMPWGGNVHDHLSALYKQAALELVSQGRLDEAAFVYVELLHNPLAAISLYESHEEWRKAAELAALRDLDAALISRLWWLAGEREAALLAARKGNAFAAVLERLEAHDQEAAAEFRLLWVDHLERSGNLLSAVEVGWEAESLRPLLHNVINRGIALGGAESAPLHAYQHGLRSTPERRAATIDMMRSLDDPQTIRLFMLAQAGVNAVDAQADRMLVTSALRAFVGHPLPHGKDVDKAHRALLQRADPLLRADLPSRGATRPKQEFTKTLAQFPPGSIPVHDAAAISADLLLVALGEMGCRLMRPDGRVIVHWDVPTHGLVLADNAASALLITGRDPAIDVHRLDLTSRKITYYGTVPSSVWTTSFDGSTWIAADDRTIAFYDTLADSPKVLWRELSPGAIVYALARNETTLSALANDPEMGGVVQVLWNLPDNRLRERTKVEPPEGAASVVTLVEGTSIWRFDEDTPAIATRSISPLTRENFGLRGDEILADSTVIARRMAHGLIELQAINKEESFAQLYSDADTINLRSTERFATVSDSSGRIMAFDRTMSRFITTRVTS